MGGGGAMRAATKVASFGINASLRNSGVYSSPSSIPVQEQSVRNVSRSVVVGKLTSSSSLGSSGVVDDAAAATAKTNTISTTSSFDDWEFAEEDDVLFDSVNPKPRLVFGGVPSYDEAKEATNDLKEAIESLSMSGHSETKSRITSESAVVTPSVTKPIFHAFSLLKESPEAQSVVASLASDKNVWDAVMRNEKVMEFFSQNTASSEVESGINQPYPDNLKSGECNTEDAEYEKCVEFIKVQQNCSPLCPPSENDPEDVGNEFMKFIEKVKITVKDMISSLSGFFQNIFGASTENISMDENGNAMVKTTIGASFMALAVLTIMVAVMKRG